MQKIQKLSPHEIQKIAAGQVVERPANIVKELLENSIDAGATQITLYLEDAGKKLIRVEDNGCGMSAEDAPLSFENHATSKIKTIQDLEQINTFGFRGEALASIAAVSKVTLITKQATTHEGLQLDVCDNRISEIQIVPAPTGTSISVCDLFHNIPVRKKFLKTKETEWRQIMQLFQAFCLDYPAVHFKLYSEDKLILNCPPISAHADRAAQLWDGSMAKHILSIDTSYEIRKISMCGFISDHQYFRYDRNTIFVFINKRWVKDFKLTNAIIKGYQNVLQQGQFPLACISVTIDPSLVDVNIHPRKEEVKFLNPHIVEQCIQETVKKGLETHLSQQLHKPASLASEVPGWPINSVSPDDVYASRFLQQQSSSYDPFNFDAVVPPQEWKSALSTARSPIFHSLPEQKQEDLPIEITPSAHYRLIGQLHHTYLLLETQEGLFLVDQHAAHERILYEQFARRFNNPESIALMFPQLVTITADDMVVITPHLELLQSHGIVIDRAGEQQLKITALPVHAKNNDMIELIKQMIGWIQESMALDPIQVRQAINEKLQAQMACKAAVKAGDVLTGEHMEQLLKDLHDTPNRFLCPHGRPTSWLISTYEIEKKFKRKV